MDGECWYVSAAWNDSVTPLRESFAETVYTELFGCGNILQIQQLHWGKVLRHNWMWLKDRLQSHRVSVGDVYRSRLCLVCECQQHHTSTWEFRPHYITYNNIQTLRPTAIKRYANGAAVSIGHFCLKQLSLTSWFHTLTVSFSLPVSFCCQSFKH